MGSNNKKTFKDKIKDRVSIMKQKSSDTLLNSRSNLHEKLSDNVDFQQCVDSLLPQLHHENEIEEALLQNVIELRVKETSQARNEQYKKNFEFFTVILNEENKVSQLKEKKKIESSLLDDEIVSSPINLNENEKTATSKKTTLKYFDTEINDSKMVTATIITKMKRETDADSLFWDGKEITIKMPKSSRSIVEEGFFIGPKPKVRSTHLKAILSHSEDQSEWFDSEGELILEDNPVCELSDQIRYMPCKEVELLTIFSKPVLFSSMRNYQTEKVCENFDCGIIEFHFETLRFNHHPLFSLEHVLGQRVIKAYELYVENKSELTLKQYDDLLFSLRSTKKVYEQKILSENDNSQKKLFKDFNYRNYIKEISKIRKKRFKEALQKKALENEILKLWRNIKYVRKQLKYVNTSLVLEINKIESNVEKDRDAWEQNFELEVSDIIDEIKCDYFKSKADFNKTNKKMKRTSIDSSSQASQKPTLEFDEVKIRKSLFNEMCETFRQPGEPIISFTLTRSPSVITDPTNSQPEVNRRVEVEKSKIFFKIILKNKEVCKTDKVSFNNDFLLKFKERCSIHLPRDTSNITLLLYEHSTFLPPSLIGEIIVKIPEHNTNSIETYLFQMKNKKASNHSGVGTCNTLLEILNKKHPQLMLKHPKLTQNIDLNEPILFEGVMNMKIGWVTSDTGQSSNQFQRKTPSKNLLCEEIPNAEILSTLFDSVLDPNDPKNSFLFSFYKNFKGKNMKSDKFYLNYFFNFDFLVTRNSNGANIIKRNVENFIGSHLEVNSNDGASTSSLSRPKGSVLDDTSISRKILDPIDLQRRTSIRYLQLVNQHLSLQNDTSKKDKQLSDIVTDFKYPGIKTITLNFLRPKRPLFYQTPPQLSSLKPQDNPTKDYTLKICILKAFQLPCRSETISSGTSGNTDEGGLKIINLKPFVRVTCQGRSLRTSTAMGNNPTWNEQLCLPVRFDTFSTISFNLFDETFEDLLMDNRLENSTVHCQYSANWLGSLKILLPTLFSQTKTEGTFLMYSPPELLGYKQNFEEKYAHSHISYDSLRRDINFKQREGFFITMFLEIFPCYMNSALPMEILETNEMDYMIKHLENFTETYKSSFPDRNINLLVLDTSGKYICITRLFKPLSLPEFGESLSTLFGNTSNYEESVSSKNSTPNKKKSSKTLNSEEVATRSTKSVISTIMGDGRRSSKATKDIFEMRSLDENLTDNGEKGLTSKIQMCTRFVAMIPLFELNSLNNNSVALSGYQTLRLVCGSMMDHTILLMNYFLHLGINCWFVSGIALPRGLSSYVLVEENLQTKELRSNEGLKSYGRLTATKSKHFWKHCIYDATSGTKYDIKDPFCPLQRVSFVCNNENIWVNIQAVERCSLTKFDFTATSDWRAVFQKNSLPSCPGPLPDLAGGDSGEENLYNYGVQDTMTLRDALEDKLRSKIQRWRGHRRTIWNRHCSSVLKSTLIHWEKWSLNQSSPKPKSSHRLQQLLLSYQIYGFPYNTTYTSTSDIVSAIKATQIHLDEHSLTEFALGVEVFPYPNRIYSIWIYLASVIRK